jgi:hypothetical protein
MVYTVRFAQSQRDHNVAVDIDSLRELTINTQ